MQIGSLTLTPAFSYAVNEYDAITTNATDTVTATPTEAEATVVVKVNTVVIENGTAAAWVEGENTVEVTVTRGEFTEVYTVTVYVPYDVTLATLTLGALELTPAFDDAVTEYTTTTANATNAVTATATDVGAEVAITVNGAAHVSGASATWLEGANEVVITVTNHEDTLIYTVDVTKTT